MPIPEGWVVPLSERVSERCGECGMWWRFCGAVGDVKELERRVVPGKKRIVIVGWGSGNSGRKNMIWVMGSLSCMIIDLRFVQMALMKFMLWLSRLLFSCVGCGLLRRGGEGGYFSMKCLRSNEADVNVV
jgi:hypothetical protein